MSSDLINYSDEDLEELEDKLLEEDFEKHKEDMPVDGRSVFEIDRLKKDKKMDDNGTN